LDDAYNYRRDIRHSLSGLCRPLGVLGAVLQRVQHRKPLSMLLGFFAVFPHLVQHRVLPLAIGLNPPLELTRRNVVCVEWLHLHPCRGFFRFRKSAVSVGFAADPVGQSNAFAIDPRTFEFEAAVGGGVVTGLTGGLEGDCRFV
jgi:hypothetical protein